MSNEIERKQGQLAKAVNGKTIRTTKEQLSRALAPMFATFPNSKMEPETFNAYYVMLCDLDPDKLAVAVIEACQAHEYPTQLITVAAIRKAYHEDQRTPGPSSDIDPAEMKPVPQRMFRLDPEEDKRQRMERLKRTKDWGRYYQ